MKFKQIVAAAALAVSSVCALATPQYSGSTTANFNENDQDNYGPFVTNGSGYYLWNDESDTSSWHLRWTSNNSIPGNSVDWAGSILFHNDKLDAYSGFSFENVQDQAWDISVPGLDIVSFTSYTNDSKGIDGLDFTLLDGTELMRFSLGSTLFNDLDLAPSDPGVASTGIYIGESMASTNVLVTRDNGMTYQSFEVKVSEPGTIALFGLGLIGLGLARRKQAA